MRRLRAHPAQPAPCLRGQHHILGGQDWLRVTVLRSLQDVTPYMNPAPFTVSPNTHVSQVFTLFRTMGLRHLPVVNAVGEVSGACEAVPPGGEPLSSAIDGAAAPRRGAPQTQPALRCPGKCRVCSDLPGLPPLPHTGHRPQGPSLARQGPKLGAEQRPAPLVWPLGQSTPAVRDVLPLRPAVGGC